jgi:SAM-dependent methyltransferase
VSTFDERARDWDTDERRARATAVAEAIRSAVSLTSAMRTIEIGAGTGLLGLALADEIGELVLAEPSSGMLEVAREKIEALGRPGVSAVSFDLLADPPIAPPFDLAISLLVLHHLSETGPALAAIFALLRPGGRLALSDLDAEDGTFHDAGAEGVHHHGFDRGRLGATAREVGFVDIAMRTATTWVNERGAFPLFLLTARRPEADAEAR